MSYKPRNILHMYNTVSKSTSTLLWVPIHASRSSGAIVVPGRLLVQGDDGTGSPRNSYGDGYQDADGTATTQKVLGLCMGVTDARKIPLTTQYLSATAGGGAFYLKATADEVFAILEDALGGSVTAGGDAGRSGNYAILIGTVTPALGVSQNTDWTAAYSNDLLDSSSYHASTVKVAVAVGLDDDIENLIDDPNDSISGAPQKIVRFKIHADHRAHG